MKTKLVLLASLAILGIATYLVSHLSAQGPAASSPAPTSVKVGMVNMAAVLKGYTKFKSYNDEIEKIRLKYEKQENDIKVNMKKTQDFITSSATNPQFNQAEREKYEGYLVIYKRQLEDNTGAYNKERTKKSDEQMVQMFKEIELGVQRFAASNGFHMIFHYSEPLNNDDKYSPPNIQRKLVGPGSSGGICPLYVLPSLDVSADVVNTLNAMYPVAGGAAPAATPATAPAGTPK